MAKSKFPRGFEPITKKLRENQIIERLKNLYESTAKVLKNKTCESEKDVEENDCLKEDSVVYRHLLDHLISASLLENTNAEISILVACCIANTFGILSPDVPTNDNEKLKVCISNKWHEGILLFFVRQLNGLSRPTNDLYPRYLYLLECISAFNIFDLALELADDSSLILKELIKTSFNAVKENQGNDDRSVQSLIITQCSQLLQRIDQITNPVIDAIFYFLAPPQKFVNRESYRMAREFILKNQSTLEPYIQMFLNHVISESELPDCNLITERSILSIVFELYEFAPEIIYPILGSVVPKLKSEDVVIRKEIVKLLGLLFGSQRSRLAEHIPELWNAYMARFNDINEEVRLVCVSLSLNILIYHPELRGQVSGLLAARCHDINDGVRLESVTVIRKLALTKFEALNEDLLNCLAGRIRDKKAKVRHEAIRAAAAVHKFVYVGEQFTESEKASVGIIMKRILNFYYQPFLDDRLLIERLFVSDFVPFRIEVRKRMQILLDVFMKFDDVEIRSFGEIFSQQSRFRRFAREICKTLEEKGQSDASINSMIQVIAESKFVDIVASDKRMLKLLKYIFGHDYTTEKVENALIEVLQRLKDNKQIPEEVVSISVGFLERYSPLQFDSTAIEELLSLAASALEKEVSVDSDKSAKNIVKILKLLQIIADNYAHFLSTERIMLLFERIIKYKNDLIGPEYVIKTSVLKILSLVSYSDLLDDGSLRESCNRLIVHLNDRIRNGSPSTAKFAVRCIVKISDKESWKETLESVAKDSIANIDIANPRCATAIKALSSCCSYIPLFVKENFSDIVSKVLSEVVLKEFEECNGDNSFITAVPDKYDYYKIHYGNGVDDECLVRIFGMRLLCDFLMSLSREKIDGDYLKNLSNEVLKMFEKILLSHGELMSKSNSSDEFAGHLRLIAGSCIIKLASIPTFSPLVTADQLVLLGSLVHDDLRFVRRKICGKLAKHLNNIRLPVEYMGLFALIPLVKEDMDFYNSGTLLLEGCILRRKKFVAKEKAESIDISPYHKPEYAVAYGLYILANQDIFISASDASSLREMKECLWFLISAFHRRCDVNSLAQIMALLEHVKLLSDANAVELPEKIRLERNKKIWALADIGILMLSYRIPPFPTKNFTKLRLSKRFYIPGPSEKGHIYLPSEIIEEESKKTVKRKRNFSGSSTLKFTVVDKSKNMYGKERRNKTTSRKQIGSGNSEQKSEEFNNNDDEIEDVAVRKGSVRKPRKLDTLYEGMEHGFEEE
uniref:Condensin complex subunit 3 n=1 Tax=Syphacia muris TaxID=451379 RepID=A0A0N5B0H8_9BILA